MTVFEERMFRTEVLLAVFEERRMFRTEVLLAGREGGLFRTEVPLAVLLVVIMTIFDFSVFL